MLCLGNLVKLILSTGKTYHFDEDHTPLIYDPDSRDLLITDLIGTQSASKPPDEQRELYYKFHADFPKDSSTVAVEWFKRDHKARRVGLIRFIHYFVPTHFNSHKRGKEYGHQFGDHGDRRIPEGADAIAAMPSLWVTSGKNARKWAHIVREPGNDWIVDDYIRG